MYVANLTTRARSLPVFLCVTHSLANEKKNVFDDNNVYPSIIYIQYNKHCAAPHHHTTINHSVFVQRAFYRLYYGNGHCTMMRCSGVGVGWRIF